MADVCILTPFIRVEHEFAMLDDIRGDDALEFTSIESCKKKGTDRSVLIAGRHNLFPPPLKAVVVSRSQGFQGLIVAVH